MRRTYLFILLLSFLSFSGAFRTEYPKDYFQAPVAGQLRLSGTFGELRPNHFHGGIDIKGGIGVPIYAAGEGFVSRIVVAPDSYGNHLYIQHPNGFTTVYAHLHTFAPEIQQFTGKKQREQEQFEVTLTLTPGQLPVQKGQIIGTMGNTGHSFGPHLHFEIRETATNKQLNPLLFGYKVADGIPPRLHEIKLYEVDDQFRTTSSRILPLVFRNSVYRVAADTIEVDQDRVGIAIKAYDHMDGVPNWNGIYSLDLYAGQDPLYGFRLDGVGADESRYLNAHIDYLEQKNRGSYYHRCFKLPGNRLGIYHPDKTGLLTLAPGESRKLNMEVRDVAGNTSRAEIVVRRKPESRPPQIAHTPYQFFWKHDRSHIVEDFQLYLHIPDGMLYEDAYIRYSTTAPASGQWSYVHRFFPEDIPLHKPFMLGLRPVDMPQRWKDKAFIAQTSGGRVTNWGGHWQDDGMLVGAVRSLGQFAIMLDTIPPSITAERFSSDMRRYSSMSFRIGDNIAASVNLPNLRFKAAIDGQWVLFSYDEKNRRISHDFSSELPRGSHTLELEVTDAMGNTASFKRTFLR